MSGRLAGEDEADRKRQNSYVQVLADAIGIQTFDTDTQALLEMPPNDHLKHSRHYSAQTSVINIITNPSSSSSSSSSSTALLRSGEGEAVDPCSGGSATHKHTITQMTEGQKMK